MARTSEVNSSNLADNGVGRKALAPTPRIAWRSRQQLAERHAELFGIAVSPRSLERWPLTWRYANGVAVADEAEFDRVANERFNAVPAVRGGRRRGTDQEAA